jgi:hypothetical protein
VTNGVDWQGTDPRGFPIQLKSSTWYQKILGSPGRLWLADHVDKVQRTAEDPELILADKSRADREVYVRLWGFDELDHPMSLVVIAEANLEQRDIVTVIPKRSLKQETGGPLYVRR